MTPELLAYINGELVPESEARVSIYDRGYMFADMVTESTRTFGMAPFKLPEHLARLYDSMKATEIDSGLTRAEMEAATLDMLDRNRAAFGPGDDAWIVHNVSRGVFHYKSEPGQNEQGMNAGPATVVIHCFPIDFPSFARFYTEGAHAITPSVRQVSPETLDPKIKHRSRMAGQLADLEVARTDPDAMAVLLDRDGNLTENTGGNFFIVKDGVVKTPTTRSVLAGVSRATVLELCAGLGIPHSEEVMQAYHGTTADEAFVTSTPYSMLPVTRFNGRPVGDGRPGPVTARLLGAWSDLVGVDIAEQAISAS
jgi:branched-chain amino acid aminotransferase